MSLENRRFEIAMRIFSFLIVFILLYSSTTGIRGQSAYNVMEGFTESLLDVYVSEYGEECNLRSEHFQDLIQYEAFKTGFSIEDFSIEKSLNGPYLLLDLNTITTDVGTKETYCVTMVWLEFYIIQVLDLQDTEKSNEKEFIISLWLLTQLAGSSKSEHAEQISDIVVVAVRRFLVDWDKDQPPPDG